MAEITLQIWFTLALVGVAIALYATEYVQNEIVSLALLLVLLLFFHFFPVADASGGDLLRPEVLLKGFANPALITVMALLVMGQGVIRTGALDKITSVLLNLARANTSLLFFLSFGAVFCLSALINNTPVVILFIPIMQTIAHRLRQTSSAVMMPLSFVAILGGMTTVIGTSTNLLVSGTLVQLDLPPFGFFDFTLPGLILATIGVVYLVIASPFLLHRRASLPERVMAGRIPRFVAKLTVTPPTNLAGEQARSNLFGVKGVRLLLVQHGEHAKLPPFRHYVLQDHDVLVLLASREALSDLASRFPGLLHAALAGETVSGDGRPDSAPDTEQLLAEVMVPPGSRLERQSLEQTRFLQTYKCLVLGVQRRTEMFSRDIAEIRLEAGDILIVQGAREDIRHIRLTRDLLPMDGWSAELTAPHLAHRAALVFLTVIALAASGAVPIVIASLMGATLMIAMGVLNLTQAFRALDWKIILLIGATLALGTALEKTGGAVVTAQTILGLLGSTTPSVAASALFLLVSLATNVLGNNATAVLFTPIAVSLAASVGSDPVVFALAVLFGANCSFATPIGYQTNLLVMGPGHYQFRDFVRFGLPLVVILWLGFSLLVAWYFHLP
jgi:di/tricarboxylate transporter